jgi:acyl-coenzyme A thioesterase 9
LGSDADYQNRRKATSQASLDQVPPSSSEAAHLHEVMLQAGNKEIGGEKVVLIKDTELESVQLMFPQDRNLHGKVPTGK